MGGRRKPGEVFVDGGGALHVRGIGVDLHANEVEACQDGIDDDRSACRKSATAWLKSAMPSAWARP